MESKEGQRVKWMITKGVDSGVIIGRSTIAGSEYYKIRRADGSLRHKKHKDLIWIKT